MSQLPDIRRILAEDLDDPSENELKIIDSVNRFMETTYDAFLELTFQDNFRSSEIDFDAVYDGVTTNLAKVPVRLKHGLPTQTRIRGVFLMRALRTDTGNFVAINDAVGVEWIQDGLDIVIQSVSGLDFTTTSARYKITILVI